MILLSARGIRKHFGPEPVLDGVTFDVRRGQLLVFGSDTHGSNWDNGVHAFDPFTGRWTHFSPPAPKSSSPSRVQ